MKILLFCIISFLLWTCCTFQHVCTPDIDFGVIIENKRAQYLERDRLQYKCFPGYDLEGSGWITCKEDGWTPRPKCFAPCTITKQQLEARNLLLYGGQKHSELIKNAHTLEFICMKGYIIISPSVRTCIDGNMDLPSCNPVVSDQETSVTGDIPAGATTSKNLLLLASDLSTPVMCTAPEIGGGNFFPVKSQYKFEEVISAKCNQGYQLESRKSSFKCTKYGWLPSPKCRMEHYLGLTHTTVTSIFQKRRDRQLVSDASTAFCQKIKSTGIELDAPVWAGIQNRNVSDIDLKIKQRPHVQKMTGRLLQAVPPCLHPDLREDFSRSTSPAPGD
ncbi:complement factor H-like isoform X6 [Podarcis raffonei]|uniref:complement factor H-like isoform X6 n=1 Tax=Podarcis raffonei TaxID=65483 RepID=UPI00232984A7|nr:complement factor H-like isoform X6 [Podarcis raffonei]